MKVGKLLGFMAVLLLVAAVVFAGGKTDSGEASEKLEGTLKIWSTLTQKERADELEKLARKYEADRPGVTVEISVMPWDASLDKIIAAHMAGNPPDLAVLGQGSPQTLAAMGAVVELSDVIQTVGGKDAFLGTSLSILGAYENGLYSVPLYVTPYVVYYRKSWLKEAGITKIPATWEEYYQMCKAVTNPAKNRYGFAMPLSDQHGMKTIWTFLQSYGVDLINQKDGKWFVDIDEKEYKACVETYEYLAKLIRDCSPQGAASYSQANVRELVAKGVIMSRIDTPEIYYNVRAMDPAALDDVAYFPMVKKTRLGSGMGWVGLSALVKGNTTLATDFIKYAFESDRLIPFYNSYPYAMFPAKKALFEDKNYRDNLPSELKPLVPDMALEILANSAALTMANGPFPGAGEAESRKVLSDPLVNMLIKGISAKEAVDQMIKNLNALIN